MTNVRLGMTASEVLVEIVRANPEISSLFFKVYTPTSNLKEDLEGTTHYLEEMLHHHGLEREICLEREEITLKKIEEIVRSLDEEKVLGVTSRSKLLNTDELSHIPMMDFDCQVLAHNLKRIQLFMKEIRQNGAVLISGGSYHYYGFELLAEREWMAFLGRCLLFDCTDARYVAHQLIDGYTTLRISESKRRPYLPKVCVLI